MLKRLNKRELQQTIEDHEAFAESASAQAVDKFRAFLGDYVKGVKSVLADTASKTSAKIDLAEQQQVVDSMRELLTESGYDAVVNEFESSLSEVGQDALKYFAEYYDKTPTFGGASKEFLDALASDLLDELDYQVDSQLVRPLENAVRNSVLSLETRAEQVADITKVINEGSVLRRDGKQFTQANIETLVSDAPRRFGQQVRNEQATELALDVFIYTGPLDAVTSEQCIFLLTEAKHGAQGFWYRDEISADMHPKLRENPLVARGHYNCRHTWMPTTEDAAKEIDPAFIPRSQ